MTDLLPCPNPWCHSHTCAVEPCYSLDLPFITTRWASTFYASCGSCGLQGPRCATKEQAATEWNDRSAVKPDIHACWKANAQANAAALNVVWEYVSTYVGGVPAKEHLPDCGADPVTIAQSIIEALGVRLAGKTNKGGQYWWAKWKEVKAVLDKAIKLTPMADAYKADVKDLGTERMNFQVKLKSDAIRAFCEAAGITPPVEIKGLPKDVQNFRAESAVAGIRAWRHEARLETNKELSELLERVAGYEMTPEEVIEQRASFVRGMSARCEHGELDFEQCPKCRSKDRRSDGSVISPYGENNPPIGDGS